MRDYETFDCYEDIASVEFRNNFTRLWSQTITPDAAQNLPLRA